MKLFELIIKTCLEIASLVILFASLISLVQGKQIDALIFAVIYVGSEIAVLTNDLRKEI